PPSCLLSGRGGSSNRGRRTGRSLSSLGPGAEELLRIAVGRNDVRTGTGHGGRFHSFLLASRRRIARSSSGLHQIMNRLCMKTGGRLPRRRIWHTLRAGGDRSKQANGG